MMSCCQMSQYDGSWNECEEGERMCQNTGRYGGPFDGEEGERIVGFTGVTPSTWDELRVLFSLFKFVFPSLFLSLYGPESFEPFRNRSRRALRSSCTSWNPARRPTSLTSTQQQLTTLLADDWKLLAIV